MSGAVVAPTSMQKVTAAAAVVKAKAKAAFEKIKPKFGERITIAGEPVYLDMPEDSKVHADRIYLKKHYLHEDAITENTKEVYRRFTAEKKVASCEKVHLDILQKGLSYRLQTVEAEAADLSEKRGNSVPLRQKLGHAQGLRDLLEVVKGEFLLCANKEAAAARRKAEEDAAAAAAALDNKPRGIEENEIQTLVKKFAVLILHASDPIDEDRPRLNKPAKNLIARLDAAPLLEGKGLETFIDKHIKSSPLLMRILAMGEEGLEEHDNFYKTLFYADLLNEIHPTLHHKFTDNLPKDDPPQETIRKIINSILHFYHAEEQRITDLNTEATGLQTRIDQLQAQLEAVKRGRDDTSAGDAAEKESLIAKLAAETAKLADVQAELEVKKNEAAKCETGLAAVTAAAAAAATKANGELAQLKAQTEADFAKIDGLDKAAVAAAANLATVEGERDRVTAEVAGFRAQIATLEAGKSGGDMAAALAEAQIATLGAKLASAEAGALKLNNNIAELTQERDAALAEVNKQKAEVAENKAKIDDLTALMQGHEDAKEAAIGERDAAVAAAAEAAATSKGIIDGLQRDAEAAKVAVAAAAAAAEDIKGKLTAKDAELNELREQLKACEANLVATRSASETEAGAAAEARAALVAEKAHLEEQIKSVTAERDSFKRQQAEEAGKVLARNAELVTAQASAAALQAQIDKFNTEAVAAAAATQRMIAEFEGKIDEKEARLAAMGDEFRRQLDTARAAAATGLADELRKKDAENKVAIGLALEALDESKRQLEKVRNEIVESQSAKNQVNTDLGTVRKALKNKNTEYTANLAAKETQLLAASEKAAVDLKAAKEAAALDKQMVVDAAAVALAAKTAELEGRIKSATDRVSAIQAEAAAAAAAAKAASDKEIAGLQTLQLKLRAEAAAMQANLRKAGADTKAAEEATAALEATNKEIAANLAEMTASEAKCKATAAAAAATAKAQIGNLSAQFRRQDEAAKEQGAQHAAALEKLRAEHAAALAAATAKAAADAKTAFDKRVADLGGEKATAIAAAEAAAKEAAGKQLAAELAKASAERQAAVTGARAEGRVAAVKEKDDAIAALKQEGAAASAAAVEAAVKAAKVEFVQREAALKAEMEAAVKAAKKTVTDEKKAELERALAAAAVAAKAATAVAVDASRESVMTAAEAELTEEKERSRAAAATAREEGSAAARADDLEKLKQLASQVLAGQAKWTSYPGADKNAALGQLLAKMDGRMSDICALVYFVSYFLNKMIRPSLVSGDENSPAKKLITNVKNLVDRLAITSDKLFELLMAIEPALLLSNKVIPRGDERLMDTMNYLIKQKTETTLLKDLINQKGSIDPVVAWQVVRNSKDDATSMRFISMENPKQVLFMHRPKLLAANDLKAADIRKGTIRTYSENGFLSSVVAEPVGALKGVIDAVDNGATPYVTYDVLFLVFLYASKKYIIDNKDSVPCTIPSEIINNSILKDNMQEREAQAAPAPKPVAPAALSIRVPGAGVPAAVASSPGPSGSPPPAAASAPLTRRVPLTAEQRAALVAANVAAQMAAAEALRPAKASLPSSASLPSEAVARGGPGQWAQQRAQGAEAAKRAEPALRLESLSAPPSPVASAPAAAAQSKCKNPAIILSISELPVLGFGEKPIKYDRIILSPRLVEIFSKDPFCFTLKNGVELNYRQFNDALDGVINRFCSGENPTKLMIPPGFRQVNNKIVVENDNACKTSKSTNEITCKLGDVAGDPFSNFLCPKQCSASAIISVDKGDIAVGSQVPTAVALNKTVAKALSEHPFCLKVQGIASVQAFNGKIYNLIDLTKKINNKLATLNFKGTIPGFTIQGKTANIILTGAQRSEGFYYINPSAGGRRTQKKKRNSKKFTQRKR